MRDVDMPLKNLMKSWGWLILLAVLLAAGFAVKHFWFTPPPAPQVATAAVALGDIEDSVLATGTIGAYKLVSVGAQVTGEVKRLHVALGDTVKQGQLIAEIDALTQQNNLRNAQAALQSAQAQLAARQAALKQATLAAARLRELVAIDAGTRADLEAAEATLSTTTAEIAAQQAQIAQARVAEDTAKVNLGYTRVTAPMDGVVVAVVTEQGQTVNANQSAPTIIKLARLDTMTVKAQISEADVPKVKPGMPVYFSLLGEPDRRIEVKLRAVEPGPTTLASETSATSSASTSTTSAIYYNGIFDVPNAEGKLRINMTAQTTIVLARAQQVLTLPSAARGQRARDGSYRVKVLEGEGKIVEKTVRIGLNNRVQAQVLDGLKAGEQVITSEAGAAGASAMPRSRGVRMF
ncbi:efflux RND transporter periplasmic adaptor subunit [Paucibacter sp. XJ19-41]|uniref:efflux RND transporter periplasmic adaptor subunit n=1 Tax=Paucibacter sp. XJ19-41 TaxID=2927824 RepID=UPI002349E785|nr:efflux RND transporter periplasmic adaptor subunit [Paucibacter sp. XJ19-41]MDC6167356.1 efflux RND transporter periplasmic adaptor subunit [Paucibacter sp. XJ19-41]